MASSTETSRIRNMLEKEAANLKDVEFDDKTSDAVLRQRINNAAVTDKQREQAKALGVPLDDELRYGAVKNILGGHLLGVSRGCIKKGDWKAGTWLEFDGKLVVLLTVDGNKGRVTGRIYDKVKRNSDHLPFLSWEVLSSTPAHELDGAVVIEPDDIPSLLSAL